MAKVKTFKTFDSLAVEALDPAQISAELRLVDGVIVVQGNRRSGLQRPHW